MIIGLEPKSNQNNKIRIIITSLKNNKIFDIS
jgi:hypothetical protein